VTGVSKGPRGFWSASTWYRSATKAIITDIDEQWQHKVFQRNEGLEYMLSASTFQYIGCLSKVRSYKDGISDTPHLMQLLLSLHSCSHCYSFPIQDSPCSPHLHIPWLCEINHMHVLLNGLLTALNPQIFCMESISDHSWDMPLTLHSHSMCCIVPPQP